MASPRETTGVVGDSLAFTHNFCLVRGYAHSDGASKGVGARARQTGTRLRVCM